MGHTIMPPSARNQAHVHDNVEVVWTLVKGHTLHFSDSGGRALQGDPSATTALSATSTPAIFTSGSTSATRRGEVVFCYAGANSKDGAGTIFVDAPDVVTSHLAEHGLTLDDLDLEQRIE